MLGIFLAQGRIKTFTGLGEFHQRVPAFRQGGMGGEQQPDQVQAVVRVQVRVDDRVHLVTADAQLVEGVKERFRASVFPKCARKLGEVKVGVEGQDLEPMEQREAVLLHVKAGMRFKDIAKVQGVSLSTTPVAVPKPTLE